MRKKKLPTKHLNFLCCQHEGCPREAMKYYKGLWLCTNHYNLLPEIKPNLEAMKKFIKKVKHNNL